MLERLNALAWLLMLALVAALAIPLPAQVSTAAASTFELRHRIS